MTNDRITAPGVDRPRGTEPPPRRSQLLRFDHMGPVLLPWVVVLVLLLLASVADYILIRTLMLGLLPFSNEEAVLSAPNLVATAVVVLSTAAMFSAGHTQARHEDTQADESVATRRAPHVVWATVTVWAALGIGLAVVRFVAAQWQIVSDDVEAERLLAILMSILYLATGTFAFVDGFLVARPFGARVRRARRHKELLEARAERLDAKIADLMGQVRRHEEVAKSPGTDPGAIADGYASQRQSIQDLAVALRRFARIEIARRVGSEEAAEAASTNLDDDPTNVEQQGRARPMDPEGVWKERPA